MYRKALAGALALLATTAVQAADPDGHALHEANCVTCHTSLMGGDAASIYTRPDHRVTSLPGLEKQVRFCQQNLNLTWFDDEIEAVAGYLNTTYYHFK